MTVLREIYTIAAKDLRSELRGKETLNSAIAFSLVILILFSFAFDPTSEQLAAISGGLLWIVFLFAGSLVVNRSFVRDLPNDCLDMLLAAPLSPPGLFFGKALANFVLLLGVEALSFVVFGVLYNVRWAQHLGQLSGVVMLATWALALLGTMFSAMTVNLRLRELMLPVLTYPAAIPALIGAIALTTDLIAGRPIGPDSNIWLRLLIGFDLVYTLLAILLVDAVLVN